MSGLHPRQLPPRLVGSYRWPASVEVDRVGDVAVRDFMPANTPPAHRITLVVRCRAKLAIWTASREDYEAAASEGRAAWSALELLALAIAGESGSLDAAVYAALDARKRRTGARVDVADLFDPAPNREDWARMMADHANAWTLRQLVACVGVEVVGVRRPQPMMAIAPAHVREFQDGPPEHYGWAPDSEPTPAR